MESSTPAKRRRAVDVGTPPCSGTELSDFSVKKRRRSSHGGNDENASQGNSPAARVAKSPAKAVQSPAGLIVPFSPLGRNGAARTPFSPLSQHGQSAVPRSPACKSSSHVLCSPVSRSSLTGEALLVPFSPRSRGSNLLQSPLRVSRSVSCPAVTSPTPGAGEAAPSAPKRAATLPELRQHRCEDWLDLAGISLSSSERAGRYAALCASREREPTASEQVPCLGAAPTVTDDHAALPRMGVACIPAFPTSAAPLHQAFEAQIDLDIVRTDVGSDSEVCEHCLPPCIQHPCFCAHPKPCRERFATAPPCCRAAQADVRRAALRRVLIAFSRHEPTTGYVQGMDSVVVGALMPATCSPPLGAVAEERAFWWLVHVASTVRPRT